MGLALGLAVLAFVLWRMRGTGRPRRSRRRMPRTLEGKARLLGGRVRGRLKWAGWISGIPILVLLGVAAGLVDPKGELVVATGLVVPVVGFLMLVSSSAIWLIVLLAWDKTSKQTRGIFGYLGFVFLGTAILMFFGPPLPEDPDLRETAQLLYSMLAVAGFLLAAAGLSHKEEQEWIHEKGRWIGYAMFAIAMLGLWYPGFLAFLSGFHDVLGQAGRVVGGTVNSAVQPDSLGVAEDGKVRMGWDAGALESVSTQTVFWGLAALMGGVSLWLLIKKNDRVGGFATLAIAIGFVVMASNGVGGGTKAGPSPSAAYGQALTPPPARIIGPVPQQPTLAPTTPVIVDVDDLPKSSRVPLARNKCPDRLSEAVGLPSDPLVVDARTLMGGGTWRRGDRDGIAIVDDGVRELLGKKREEVRVAIAVGGSYVNVKVDRGDDLLLCPDTPLDGLAATRGQEFRFSLTFGGASLR
jgi:hypothetical protein